MSSTSQLVIRLLFASIVSHIDAFTTWSLQGVTMLRHVGARRVFEELDQKDEHSIRVLRFLPQTTSKSIHCILIHISSRRDPTRADDPIEYTALSYCCGDPATTKSITVNGTPFPVTSNLWNALSAIVDHHTVDRDSEHFWVDAICINQSDTQEKTHQVAQMAPIYRRAKRVLAWLGEEDEHTEEAFGALQRVTTDFDEYEETNWQKWPEADAIKLLSKREYFTRTWIIQEV